MEINTFVTIFSKTNFRTDIIKYRVGKLKYILENKDPLMSVEDYSGWTCRISIEHWTTFFLDWQLINVTRDFWRVRVICHWHYYNMMCQLNMNLGRLILTAHDKIFDYFGDMKSKRKEKTYFSNVLTRCKRWWRWWRVAVAVHLCHLYKHLKYNWKMQ